MNCTINSASNFSGLQAGISQISPAQLAAPVRKSTLNRPFISPILRWLFMGGYLLQAPSTERLSSDEAARLAQIWGSLLGSKA